ncbi:MAG: hypothetical protein HGB22_09630 [Chlorobiaceae bacterium]|nr:hypothetical protein [Chlorobiaceae bacterium]
MSFLHEPLFWLLAAACLAISSTPSVMRSIGKKRIISIVMLWASACVAIYLLYGTVSTILATTVSAGWGALLLAASLIRSGLKSMPNNRF